MAQGIWIVAEQREGELRKISFELVSEARRLADTMGQPVAAILLGSNIKEKAAELGKYGADKVVVADDDRLASPGSRTCHHPVSCISSGQGSFRQAGGQAWSWCGPRLRGIFH